MKVTFELDLSIPYEEESTEKEISEYIMDRAINAFVENLWNIEFTLGYSSEIKSAIDTIVKEHKDEIINRIVERTSERIAAKKAIKEITPKVSELAAIDEENIAYFTSMIDKAIARRFKS